MLGPDSTSILGALTSSVRPLGISCRILMLIIFIGRFGGDFSVQHVKWGIRQHCGRCHGRVMGVIVGVVVGGATWDGVGDEGVIGNDVASGDATDHIATGGGGTLSHVVRGYCATQGASDHSSRIVNFCIYVGSKHVILSMIASQGGIASDASRAGRDDRIGGEFLC